MGSLVRFELKKMLARRVTQGAVAVVFLMLAAASVMNVAQQYALDPAEMGHEFEGLSAVAQDKANADALAGPITDEIATEKLRAFQAFIGDDGEIAEQYRWDSQNAGPDAEAYWAFHAANGDYLALLTGPWDPGSSLPVTVAAGIDTSETVDLYGQARAKVESKLAGGSAAFSYTDAERAFWTGRADAVATPVEYGFTGGWRNFLEMAQFLIFALIAVVIAAAPTFNVEYREKTDAVLLATRLGKSRLGLAKVLAALVVATGAYWLMVAVTMGLPLALFGADGAGLPLQVRNLSNVYSISIGGAALVVVLVGYVVMLGLLGITLALSSRMRSSMGILAAAAALVMVPMFVPNLQNNVANHVLYLFPFFSLEPANLFGMVSYAAGPLVLAYPVVLVLLYMLLFVAGSLFAARSFGRHQVA